MIIQVYKNIVNYLILIKKNIENIEDIENNKNFCFIKNETSKVFLPDKKSEIITKIFLYIITPLISNLQTYFNSPVNFVNNLLSLIKGTIYELRINENINYVITFINYISNNQGNFVIEPNQNYFNFGSFEFNLNEQDGYFYFSIQHRNEPISVSDQTIKDFLLNNTNSIQNIPLIQILFETIIDIPFFTCHICSNRDIFT